MEKSSNRVKGGKLCSEVQYTLSAEPWSGCNGKSLVAKITLTHGFIPSGDKSGRSFPIDQWMLIDLLSLDDESLKMLNSSSDSESFLFFLLTMALFWAVGL